MVRFWEAWARAEAATVRAARALKSIVNERVGGDRGYGVKSVKAKTRKPRADRR